jgi:hypothetical protein
MKTSKKFDPSKSSRAQVIDHLLKHDPEFRLAYREAKKKVMRSYLDTDANGNIILVDPEEKETDDEENTDVSGD